MPVNTNVTVLLRMIDQAWRTTSYRNHRLRDPRLLQLEPKGTGGEHPLLETLVDRFPSHKLPFLRLDVPMRR